MFIDPMNKEEEERVNSLSIEEIINDKVTNAKSRQNSANPIHRSKPSSVGTRAAIVNGDMTDLQQGQRPQSQRQHQNTRSRPSSNCSAFSDRSTGIQSPKLKTQPLNSSHNPAMSGNLSIMTPGAKYTPPINEMPRSAKVGGRVSPTKPLHRSGAGTPSSIKGGSSSQQGETEYIKITTSLRLSKSNGLYSSPVPNHHFNGQSTGYDFRPGSNTPQDGIRTQSPINPAYYGMDNLPPVSNNDSEPAHPNHDPSIMNNYDDNFDGTDDNIADANAEGAEGRCVSVSPAPTSVAISIPTADELSDKDSLNNSPSRPGIGNNDDLTSYQRRERDLRKEQIDQLTDLLGGAVVDAEREKK